MNSRTKYLLPQHVDSIHFEISPLHHLPNDALHVAAANGYMPDIRNMLAYNPQLANQAHSTEGTIPLCWALQNNQTEAIALLLNYSQFPRIAPLPRNSPLHFLDTMWAKANPEFTQKLLTNSGNFLNFAYEFAFDSLDYLELSTLIQNYLMIVKHGQKYFLYLLDIGIKIKACLSKLYLSTNKHGYKTFHTLIAWINLSVCRPIFNQFSTEEQALILGVVKNINLDDKNFQARFMHTVRTLATINQVLESDSNLELIDNYSFFNSHSAENILSKNELALVLFDAADYEVQFDLAEKLYKGIQDYNSFDHEALLSLKKTADYINNANPHLAAKALLALQNETAMNSFKAVIVLRMMMNAAIDRKINHTDGIISNLIMRAIVKAINLLGDFKQKNNDLGDLFEAAGDAYKIHLYSRCNGIYPLEPLKRLYATAESLQSTSESLNSSRLKLFEITRSARVQQPQLSLSYGVGLFGRFQNTEQLNIAAKTSLYHSGRNNQFHRSH